MSDRMSMAAAMLLDLRTPLARLSLAAQRFAREAVRPADRALAAGMQDAVLEIDTRIDRILPLLSPVEPTSTGSPSEAAPIFEQLAERLRPALEAQGIEFELLPPTHGLELDAHAARRLAATLVQAGATWVGAGGMLTLGTHVESSDPPALELVCTRAAPPADLPAQPQPDFVLTPELQALAERFVLTRETPDRVRIAVWLGASS